MRRFGVFFAVNMRTSRPQSLTSPGICQYLACLALLLPACNALASEAAVEPSDNGTDILEDSTVDTDSRSSETTAAAEQLVEAVPAHEPDVPLAEAVTTAEGQAEPLLLLGSEILPGRRIACPGMPPSCSRAYPYRHRFSSSTARHRVRRFA